MFNDERWEIESDAARHLSRDASWKKNFSYLQLYVRAFCLLPCGIAVVGTLANKQVGKCPKLVRGGEWRAMQPSFGSDLDFSVVKFFPSFSIKLTTAFGVGLDKNQYIARPCYYQLFWS